MDLRVHTLTGEDVNTTIGLQQYQAMQCSNKSRHMYSRFQLYFRINESHHGWMLQVTANDLTVSIIYYDLIKSPKDCTSFISRRCKRKRYQHTDKTVLHTVTRSSKSRNKHMYITDTVTEQSSHEHTQT